MPYFGKASPIKIAEEKDVVEVVINSLPLPSPDTPWEKIFDFRNDEEARGNLAGLRKWISEKSRLNITINEIEQELKWLIHMHKKYLERHRMNINPGRIETYLTIGAEILDSLVRKEFSKAVQVKFSFRRRKFKLLEIESSAPNPELAFIKSREIFS